MTAAPASLRFSAAGCVGIIAVAFWTSAHAIEQVGRHSHIEPSWGLVASIDMVILVVAPIAWRRAGAGRPTPWATITLAAYGLVSIGANISYVEGGVMEHFWRAVPPVTMLVVIEWLLSELRDLRVAAPAARRETKFERQPRRAEEPAATFDPGAAPQPAADDLTMRRRTRAAFTAAQRAAILAEAADAPDTEVARRHGIHRETLRRWRQQQEKAA